MKASHVPEMIFFVLSVGFLSLLTYLYSSDIFRSIQTGNSISNVISDSFYPKFELLSYTYDESKIILYLKPLEPIDYRYINVLINKQDAKITPINPYGYILYPNNSLLKVEANYSYFQFGNYFNQISIYVYETSNNLRTLVYLTKINIKDIPYTSSENDSDRYYNPPSGCNPTSAYVYSIISDKSLIYLVQGQSQSVTITTFLSCNTSGTVMVLCYLPEGFLCDSPYKTCNVSDSDSCSVTFVITNSNASVGNYTATFESTFGSSSESINITLASVMGVYLRKIIVNNTLNTNTLIDYQINITVDTETPISQGKMKPDCGDVRFTYLNTSDYKEYKIPYWIESGCNTSNTIIWIKVPYISANGNATVYMYYGNPNATSESNPHNVFDWYDDFSTNTLSNYDIVHNPGWHPIPYSNMGGCTFTHDATNGRLTFSCPAGYYSYISPKTTLLPNMTNVALRFNVLFTSFSDGNSGISAHLRFIDISNNYYIALSNDRRESELGKRVNGVDTVLTETNFAAATNTRYTLEFRISDNRLEYWRNMVLAASRTDYSITSAGRVVIFPSEASGWIDNIIVRKYTYPEPSVIIGYEEILT